MKKKDSLKKIHNNLNIIKNMDMSDYNKFKIERYKKLKKSLKELLDTQEIEYEYKNLIKIKK